MIVGALLYVVVFSSVCIVHGICCLCLSDGYPSGSILYLGHYQSDFDWDNETLRVRTWLHSNTSIDLY